MTESSHKVTITTEPSAGELTVQDIVLMLQKQWRLIVGIVLSFTILAAVAAFIMPKTYMAESILLPPHESDVMMLNIPNPYATGEDDAYLYQIGVEDLYKIFIRNLRSNALRLHYFEQYGVSEALAGEQGDSAAAYEVFQKKFNEQLSVEEIANVKQQAEIVEVRLEGSSPENVTKWLNGYIAYVDSYTVESIKNAIKARIDIESASVAEQIGTMRMTAEIEKQDELARLGEAAKIAEKLGIIEETGLSRPEKVQLSASGGDMSTGDQVVEVDYRKGTKALQEEIAVLQARKNMDPYIPGLRRLQKKVALLKNIASMSFNVRAARIDQEAVEDLDPVKPRVALIVVLGALAGLFIALGGAVIKELISKQRMEVS